MKLDAILWDYDGTLVNSVPKNIDITKTILSIVAPHRTGEHLPVYLQSEQAYREVNHAAKNWQELYTKYYGLTEYEMLEAGKLWAEQQELNQTEVRLFDGIKTLIHQNPRIQHGICSQNSQLNIRRLLQENSMAEPFKSVIGYDDVAHSKQKPDPQSGIDCLREIFGSNEYECLMYIGDHQADTLFARNLQSVIGDNVKVVSVAVSYSGAKPEGWYMRPDYIAKSVVELQSIITEFA